MLPYPILRVNAEFGAPMGLLLLRECTCFCFLRGRSLDPEGPIRPLKIFIDRVRLAIPVRQLETEVRIALVVPLRNERLR